MNSIELLKHESNLAFKDLKTALDGVSEGLSWARLPQKGKDFLHTDGSIYGITLHIAVCKKMYGSVGFKESEVKWHDCAEQVAKIEPSWSAAVAYLDEAQAYWMSTWDGLTGADLEGERPHFSGCYWPAWKLIHTVIHHDGYHGGQIALLRYGCSETTEHPESVEADIRTHCCQLPDW